MTDKNFSEEPKSYVKFKWQGREMEGEFFQASLSLFDDPQSSKGYIRPFDKALRQSIVDIHQNCHKIDYDDFCTVGDLIECDSLVTHADLKRPYLDVVVTDYEFIDEIDLSAEKASISDCRLDILRRQLILAKALNIPEDAYERIQQEFNKWETPDFEPLRYKRSKLNKIIQNLLIQFLAGIVLLLIVVKM